MGWYFIRRGEWRRHMACMIMALLSSVCFLVGYITYHARVGEKSSGYTGWLAAVYFPILASHVLLAFVTLAAGHFDACSGFSSPMGQAQADCALDGSNLALRLYHRSARVPGALQMVPSGHALIAVASAIVKELPGNAHFPQDSGKRKRGPMSKSCAWRRFDVSSHRCAAAHGGDFYGDDCHVQ